MSRSNLDKPFYVDVGTSIVAVRCASNHDVILEYDHGRSPQSQPTIQMAKDICDRMNKEVEIHNSGDCAKLREALTAILKEANTQYQNDNGIDLTWLMEKAKTALAAPPRNCDRFASAEEALDAYDEWVESYRANGEVPPFNEFGWLFAPATEKEGGAK